MTDDELHPVERLHRGVKDAADLGQWLAKKGANLIRSGRTPSMVMVIEITPGEPPVVTWNSKWAVPAEVVNRTLGRLGPDLMVWMRQVAEGDTTKVNDYLAERHRMRAFADQKRQEADADRFGRWRCEFCNARYKTQRGAERHELGCISGSRPEGHRHAGFHRSADATGEHRCECGFRGPGTFAYSMAMRQHLNEHRTAEVVRTLVEVHP